MKRLLVVGALAGAYLLGTLGVGPTIARPPQLATTKYEMVMSILPGTRDLNVKCASGRPRDWEHLIRIRTSPDHLTFRCLPT
jgi:hypothetical protein